MVYDTGKKEQVTMHTSEKRLATFHFLDLPTVDVITSNLEALYAMVLNDNELRRTKILKFPGIVSNWCDGVCVWVLI